MSNPSSDETTVQSRANESRDLESVPSYGKRWGFCKLVVHQL